MEVGAAAKAEQERRSKPHGRALSRHLSAPVKQVRWVPLGVDVYRDRPADLHGAEHIVRDYRLAFVTELQSRPSPFARQGSGAGKGEGLLLFAVRVFILCLDATGPHFGHHACVFDPPTHPPTHGQKNAGGVR